LNKLANIIIPKEHTAKYYNISKAMAKKQKKAFQRAAEAAAEAAAAMEASYNKPYEVVYYSGPPSENGDPTLPMDTAKDDGASGGGNADGVERAVDKTTSVTVSVSMAQGEGMGSIEDLSLFEDLTKASGP
jgi:hypothetical protein